MDLINREEAINAIYHHIPYMSRERATIILHEVNGIEVTRCSDCKHWDTAWQTIEGQHYCPMVDKQTLGDFFCADGERGEE